MKKFSDSDKVQFCTHTCLLSDGGGLALAIPSYCDDADVVVDTRLQAIHSVGIPGRLHKVIKDGYTIARSHHSDVVTSYCSGVNRTPCEADRGVGDIDKVEVCYLGHVYEIK